jgi:hypothetical protein
VVSGAVVAGLAGVVDFVSAHDESSRATPIERTGRTKKIVDFMASMESRSRGGQYRLPP